MASDDDSRMKSRQIQEKSPSWGHRISLSIAVSSEINVSVIRLKNNERRKVFATRNHQQDSVHARDVERTQPNPRTGKLGYGVQNGSITD